MFVQFLVFINKTQPNLSGAHFLCSEAEQKIAGTEGGNSCPNKQQLKLIKNFLKF